MGKIGWRPSAETRQKMKTNRKLAWERDTIVIYEDWNEDADGNIWYRWREEGEKNWHSLITPYKQKPVVRMKRLHRYEYGKLLEKLTPTPNSEANKGKEK